jgi:two-component system response regulator YesN
VGDLKVLEEIITEEEQSRLWEWVKQQLLVGMVKGHEQPRAELLEAIGWQDSSYQVVYSRSFQSGQQEGRYYLSDLLLFGSHENGTFMRFLEGEGEVLLLRGKGAIKYLKSFMDHYLTISPEPGSPMYSLFFTCGNVVKRPEDIHQSYQTARRLMQRRFFAEKNQHIMDTREFTGGKRKALDAETVEQFGEELVNSIQTFNKSLLAHQIQRLWQYLKESQEQEEVVRIFLTELYMQIWWKIREKHHIPEEDQENSRTVLSGILKLDYLYQVLDCLANDLDGLMHAIGGPSRDSVLNDILFYIQHNMSEQLKLEKIAPLFGYNSAYLGKIFKQNVGESFNTYVDRIRIEEAKKLLKQEKLKVYEISERVGYRNVDYFHKKFLKYVKMSPAAYRKLQQEQDET